VRAAGAEALAVTPRILILEYNALFGAERRVTIPQDQPLDGTPKGYNGASLAALTALAERKGYRLVTCENAGVNAFYLRHDVAPGVRAVTPAEAFKPLRSRVDLDDAEIKTDIYAAAAKRNLPLLDWTIDTHIPVTGDPRSVGGQFPPEVVTIDPMHVWYPRNTEFEIFRVNRREHRLGAVFVLNHRTRFTQQMFPFDEVIKQARAEGALLDLEKHNWPWTIAMVPILKPDLIELVNNHHWEVEYAVRNWAVPAPAWMKLSGSGTDNERDWTFYGFHSYYALLNSGFRIAATAGTASGVHPVPLGFNRVYVQLDEPFSYEAGMRGVAAGRSFVTNGPMLRRSPAGASSGSLPRQWGPEV
jgi:hypothetical protein